jgi:hypothetical protein
MTRARDDARRNARAEFALYDADREPVGAFSIGHADGCQEGFTEDGDGTWADVGGESHVPGSHDELHRVLVAPRRVFARQRSARGIPTVPERCRCIAGNEHYVGDHLT